MRKKLFGTDGIRSLANNEIFNNLSLNILSRAIVNNKTNLKIVVGLGKIGFESFLHYTRNDHELKMKDYPFKHGVGYALPSGITLYGAYHPSPRNVNTKRITFDMMVAFLKQLKNEI